MAILVMHPTVLRKLIKLVVKSAIMQMQSNVNISYDSAFHNQTDVFFKSKTAVRICLSGRWLLLNDMALSQKISADDGKLCLEVGCISDFSNCKVVSI